MTFLSEWLYLKKRVSDFLSSNHFSFLTFSPELVFFLLTTVASRLTVDKKSPVFILVMCKRIYSLVHDRKLRKNPKIGILQDRDVYESLFITHDNQVKKNLTCTTQLGLVFDVCYYFSTRWSLCKNTSWTYTF